MALNYYQTVNPGWGTQQYRFGPPRSLQIQPQSTWGGMDYYQNYAGQVADPNLYQHAWDRVRDHSHAQTAGVDAGVGLYEARHWHKKAYGSDEIFVLGARELGHAAAYEAYREWIHDRSLYEPLRGDYERQREGLVGLAVGEVTHLLKTRPLDHYARMMASETAASTANNLFWESQEREEDEGDFGRRGRSRSRVRSGSVYGSAMGSTLGSSYDPLDDDDPYAIDEVRRRRRGRSVSRHRNYAGVSPSATMPMPQIGGVATSAYGQPVGSVYGQPQASVYSQPTSYGTSAYGTTAGYGVANTYAQPSVAATQYLPGVQYAQSAQQVPMVYSTAGSTRSGRSRSRRRSNSVSVPSAQYAGVYPSTGGQQVVLVQPKKSKHRKHSKHRSHSRSRSFFG
ncbi:hypothetical protein DL96DRAFT_1603600 [Flagelloscypha sp. PMI_526]|nr:hypothetical protein DL96DRAFT_1603600 [Flagelloscypha sp. PMI_526]